MLDTGFAMTAKTRHGLQRFLEWLVDMGKVDRIPMQRIHPPQVSEVSLSRDRSAAPWRLWWPSF